MQKLLLPIDGSDCALKTVQWAARTFNPNETEYYLLSIIPTLSGLNMVQYNIEDATTIFNVARAELKASGCHVAKAEYLTGDVVSEICRYADEIEADLVLIGSHGRTGLAEIFMGSTSMAVMKHCKRPVSIYRNVEVHPAPLHLIPDNTLL